MRLAILAVAGLALVMLYVIGGFVGESRCGGLNDAKVEIGECRECWSVSPAEVRSELCPGSTNTTNATCTAEPFLLRHNAIVDVVTCACGKARAASFGNANVNQQIEELYSKYTGASAKVEEICGLNTLLTKRSY